MGRLRKGGGGQRHVGSGARLCSRAMQEQVLATVQVLGTRASAAASRSPQPYVTAEEKPARVAVAGQALHCTAGSPQ